MAIVNFGVADNPMNKFGLILAQNIMGTGGKVSEGISAGLQERSKIRALKEMTQYKSDSAVKSRMLQIQMEEDAKQNALADKLHQNYSNMVADDPMKAKMFHDSDAGRQLAKFLKRVKGSDVVDAKGNLIPLPPQRKADSMADIFAVKIKQEMGNTQGNPWSDGLTGDNQQPSTEAGITANEWLKSDEL